MINRVIRPLKSNSFFIFGPRGTGKTTFLKRFFEKEKVLWIDLLDPKVEEAYSREAGPLSYQSEALKEFAWIVIDEIQKAPKLLDLVHHHIESSGKKFALTGSSPRKLKKEGANLLAGRAFLNHLFPLTHTEMGNQFDLTAALHYGSLPRVTQLSLPEEKNEFLRAYAHTYLKEEIWAEHLIRQLEPFRRFLEIAAQTSGQIVNYSNVARDVGVETPTVQSYFSILEDTLVGVLLEPFHYSVRKRQRHNPKFYLFDLGVRRAMERTLESSLTPGSYAYGLAFEHFVILEAYRLNSYHRKDFRFFYLRTKDDSEIDLIVERPGMPTALIEIKSTDHADERDTRTLERFLPDFKKAEAFCLSRDPWPKKIGSVSVLPWDQGLRELGL
ncbi:MAG: ATP-binding protein [Deltaproteobacteria bacterium]|nr:ATP-binding protein [Deltaproteobacteria bacterium]